MESLLYDLRYALRRLCTSPGFTLTAILTLAFGIGATTAIFSIVEGVLLRPLPFPDQASLVMLGDILEGVKYGADAPGVTAPGIRIYMRDAHAFSSLGGYQPSTYELSGKFGPSHHRIRSGHADAIPIVEFDCAQVPMVTIGVDDSLVDDMSGFISNVIRSPFSSPWEIARTINLRRVPR